jgi:hypothetical protein
MTLNVNHYGSNYSQRLGKESSIAQEGLIEDRLSKQTEQAKEKELIHITPTFRHTRTANALVVGGLFSMMSGGVMLGPHLLHMIYANADPESILPKRYGLLTMGVALGAGLLGGALGYFGSKGAVQKAKYDYEMKNSVDLIPVKGSDGYKPVYNDHKVEKS